MDTHIGEITQKQEITAGSYIDYDEPSHPSTGDFLNDQYI